MTIAEQTFDRYKLIQFWIESSDADYDTMQAMMDVKKYNWALFVGHLMIEKLLKAYFVRINATEWVRKLNSNREWIKKLVTT